MRARPSNTRPRTWKLYLVLRDKRAPQFLQRVKVHGCFISSVLHVVSAELITVKYVIDLQRNASLCGQLQNTQPPSGFLTKYNGMQPVPMTSSHCVAMDFMTLSAPAAPAVQRWNSSKQSPVLHSASTAFMMCEAAPRHGCHMRSNDCTWLVL